MKNVVFRQSFTDLPKHVNWFPGHMRKAMNDLEAEIKKADMFLEVRDSRIPYTSHNEELLSMIPKSMKRIIIFNKIDLANEKQTLAMIKDIKEKEKADTIHISPKKSLNIGKLLTMVSKNISPQFKTVGAWIMIGGIPNVGKSTILNSLRKKDE